MSGSYSGTNYDRWSYEQAAKDGQLANTPINKLQSKFWLAKQKVTKKLGKEEDEHVVASDSQLDAKLQLFKSINETTCRLQFLIERYQDSIYHLAGEENALGRFLKEEGKVDKTRAGKMMVAAGKTMSYTGQQRLAIRVPLVRLYQEVEVFRQRAIEDMKLTVNQMERVRTEYRAALMWMKNVSTELDPDTFRQLEKFRKVQINVRDSKKRFDKLTVDVLQKVDLLAASRCNMFSHALIMYQNTLVTFWDKTSKTMNHVNNGFKGYQHYEFNYIKDLATPREPSDSEDKKHKSKSKKNDGAVKEGETEKGKSNGGSMVNLLNLNSQESGGGAPTLDDDDEILLRIDNELEEGDHSAELDQIGDLSKIFNKCNLANDGDAELLNLTSTTQESLDSLLADGQQGTFTQDWEKHCQTRRKDSDGFSDFASNRATGSAAGFLPSQLFDCQPGGVENLLDLSTPTASAPNWTQHLGESGLGAAGGGSAMLTATPNQLTAGMTGTTGSTSGGAGAKPGASQKDMAAWFSLFAELDPLGNPDNVGSNPRRDCL